MDGNKVDSLGFHKILTFYVAHGYHEVSTRLGPNNPTVAFTAEGGQDYFFQMDYEHAMFPTSPKSDQPHPDSAAGNRGSRKASRRKD